MSDFPLKIIHDKDLESLKSRISALENQLSTLSSQLVNQSKLVLMDVSHVNLSTVRSYTAPRDGAMYIYAFVNAYYGDSNNKNHLVVTANGNTTDFERMAGDYVRSGGEGGGWGEVTLLTAVAVSAGTVVTYYSYVEEISNGSVVYLTLFQ